MADEFIKVSEDSGIVTITLNRPERLNAFFGHMRRDLAEALEEAGSDPHVRVVVITGAGFAFCAGGDVHFMAELVERNDTEEFERILGAARRVVLAIRQMTKPVIASISGPASGAGFNLALACDLRIARRDAGKIGLPEVTLGVLPGTGGTQRLGRIVGRAKAIEMMAEGTTVPVEEGKGLGIVNAVLDVPADGFRAAAIEYARKFVPPAKASRAVGFIKRAVTTGLEVGLEQGLALERELQQRLFEGKDAAEGIAAYNARRPPQFSGK